MKWYFGLIGAISVGALGTSMVLNNSAEAIPAFATKTDKNCSYCHSPWPQLNAKGRAYKSAGYRLPEEVGKDTGSFLEDGFPVSAVLVARPYDKKGSGDSKIRALHEAEVIVAASLGKNLSGFFELEAEDETDFNVEVPQAALTYSVREELNIQASYGDIFFADPYGLLADHFRLTRGHVGAIDQKFGGADNKLRSRRQNMTAYGRVSERFFYMLGYSGNAGDAEGVDAKNILFRGAVDVTDNIMVGGFYLDGKNSVSDREYSRVGIDFLAEVKDFRISGVYINAKDDTPDLLGDVSNNAWSVQGSYVFKKENGQPTFVPTIRLDQYEKNNGMDKYSEVSVNLAYYPVQNAKVYLEYWDRFDVPTGAAKNHRLTLQAVFSF